MDEKVQERQSTLDIVVVQAEKDRDYTGKKRRRYAFWAIPNPTSRGAAVSVCSLPPHHILLVPDFVYNYVCKTALCIKLVFLTNDKLGIIDFWSSKSLVTPGIFVFKENLAIPLLGIHTEETRSERDMCTPMFIAAPVMIARTWKQPRCPSADEWIRKLWYIYTIEYYSAIKKNSFESVLMRWMKLESIIQSEVS